MTDPSYTRARHECTNNHPHCAALATTGACTQPADYDEEEEDNEDEEATKLYEFMMEDCAPACGSCEESIINPRSAEDDLIIAACTPDESTNIFKEGELEDMFLRIVGELPFEEGVEPNVPDYKVNIHSRPLKAGDEDLEEDELDYHVGPWIVTLDNFLTDEECDRLVELGTEEGYARSSLQEEDTYGEEQLKFETESDDAYRTSTNSWCMSEACNNDPITRRVIQKIESTTSVPDAYAEHLQLLKYGE